MKAILSAALILAFGILAQCAWVKEMENPDLFEGDIVLDPDEMERRNRTHVFCSIKGGRWPGAKVPYVITNSIGSKGVRAIKAAIGEYHKHTCIRFHPRTNEREYISFYRGQGCNSPIGWRRGRVNHISLDYGCWWTGTTVHEIGHSMGFDHEQNRPDRDKFVIINWNNIQKGLAFAFYKQPKERIDSLGTPYDLKSTMHYGSYAFSKNRRPTITVKDRSKQGEIGDNRLFSKVDIIQLNLMYCKGKGGGGGTGTDPPSTEPPSTCDNKNPRCDEWAKRGECVKNQPWMLANCCKACKDVCGECKNKNPKCDEWAGQGYCHGSHGYWMRCNCCVACKGK